MAMELIEIIIKFPINVLSQLSDDNLRKVATELKMVYETKEQTISRLGKTLNFATTLESNIEAAKQSLMEELNSFFQNNDDNVPKQEVSNTTKQRASSSYSLSASRYRELSEMKEHEYFAQLKPGYSIIITSNIENYPLLEDFICDMKSKVEAKTTITWIKEAQNVNNFLGTNPKRNAKLIAEFNTYCDQHFGIPGVLNVQLLE